MWPQARKWYRTPGIITESKRRTVRGTGMDSLPALSSEFEINFTSVLLQIKVAQYKSYGKLLPDITLNGAEFFLRKYDSSRSATQDILHILWNTKIHYDVHNCSLS
jgi:hypothetical protein